MVGVRALASYGRLLPSLATAICRFVCALVPRCPPDNAGAAMEQLGALPLEALVQLQAFLSLRLPSLAASPYHLVDQASGGVAWVLGRLHCVCFD